MDRPWEATNDCRALRMQTRLKETSRTGSPLPRNKEGGATTARRRGRGCCTATPTRTCLNDRAVADFAEAEAIWVASGFDR